MKSRETGSFFCFDKSQLYRLTQINNCILQLSHTKYSMHGIDAISIYCED